MDLLKFQSGLSQVLFSPYGESQFETLRTVTGGMSGIKTAKLLNFAVECTDINEIYCEIGVYTGYTMIAAGLGHERNIVGIDNSSEFGDKKEWREANLRMFPHSAYEFIPHDFRNVGFDPKTKGKMGVLYIDGKHEYQELMDSFYWAHNGFLSPHSIVVVDDLALPEVANGVHDWVTNHVEYSMLFYLKPSMQHDISVGLGFAVLKKESINVKD